MKLIKGELKGIYNVTKAFNFSQMRRAEKRLLRTFFFFKWPILNGNKCICVDFNSSICHAAQPRD